jgi:hypothetical protein
MYKETKQRKLSTKFTGTPIVIRFAKPLFESVDVYDNEEKYNYFSQTLEEGLFFMGSPKRNTRCNRFTIIGADKKHNDDTKEKK